MKLIRKTLLSLTLGILMIGISVPVHAASVSVSIPESGQDVKPGDHLYFQVDFLYPENVGRHDFTIQYTVLEGNTVIVTSQFIKAVETQASFVDYVIVPQAAKKGLHTISVRIVDDTGTVIAPDATASFQVASTYDWATVHFYILLGTIVSIGVVLALELRQLQRQLPKRFPQHTATVSA